MTADLFGAFTDIGAALIPFQGGYVQIQGHGCPGCGNGFWTEADDKRRLDPAKHACQCPHCGEARKPSA